MTITLKIPAARQAATRAKLAAAGFSFSTPDHTFWQGRTEGVVISFYRSGKVVLQGKASDAWADELGGTVHKRATPGEKKPRVPRERSGEPFGDALALLPEPAPESWIGIDEAGKGDYFGPLVVAAARVERDQLGWLAELGVADSKALTDKRAKALAPLLEEALPIEQVILLPPKYNELYGEIGNLNVMLGWAHAAAAEKVLERADAELILSDQFSKSNHVKRQLKTIGRTKRFTQRTKAESDPAVAAASVVARATFLRCLERLGRDAGFTLPKGASSPVLQAAKRWVRERGPDSLVSVAKLHFRTTEKAKRG